MDPNSNVAVTSQPKQKNIVAKLIFVVLTVGVVIAVLLVLFRPKSPSVVANNFINYVLEDDATDSYTLTSSAFQQSTSLSRWGSNVSTVSNNCNGSATLSEQSSTTSSITYNVKVTNRYGSCNMQVTLVQTGKDWQVNYFNPTETKR